MAEPTETPDSNQTSTAKPAAARPEQHSRIATVWLTLAVFVIILILLIIFILQNSMTVHIKYFGANGKLQFGVAMLISAVAGALLTLLIGSARIVQLKLRGKARGPQSSTSV